MGKSCKFSIPSADVVVDVGSSVKATYTFHNQSVIMIQLMKDLASKSKLQKTHRMIYQFEMNAEGKPVLSGAAPKDAPQLEDIAMLPVLIMERSSWEEAWVMNRMRQTCAELVEQIKVK